MSRIVLAPTLAGLCLIATGCATVDPQPSVDAVRELAATRVRADVEWPHTDEERAATRRRVDTLLADGLSRENAVRVAILNSPVVRMALTDLGIATANEVEAGLPANPTLDVFLAFPLNAADSTIGLSGYISDLWMLPKRVRLAEMARRQAELKVAIQLMTVAAEAEAAWDELVVARQTVDHARRIVDVRRELAREVDAGAAHDPSRAGTGQRSVLDDAQQVIALLAAEQRLTEAETDLALALGVIDAAKHVPASATLPEAPPDLPSKEEAFAFAMGHRLDVALAEAEIERRAELLGLQDALVWSSVAVGVAYNGDFNNIFKTSGALGPSLAIDIPVFNQNQAGKATARYELERAMEALRFVQLTAAKQVADRYAGLERARAVVEVLEQTALSLSRKRAEVMRTERTPLEALDAEADLLLAEGTVLAARHRVQHVARSLHMALYGGPG